MPRTEERVISQPPFVVDWSSLERSTGRQVDWANVGPEFTDPTTGRKRIPAGTPVGELLSGDGRVSPRVAVTNPAVGIMETACEEGRPGENARQDAKSGYGMIVGGVLYENLLPAAVGGPPALLPAAVKTELRDAGCTFKFDLYQDNRGA